MARTNFQVHYGSNTARFSKEVDGRIFGRTMSGFYGLVEMSDRRAGGLVGQWRDGKATPEFNDRDDVR